MRLEGFNIVYLHIQLYWNDSLRSRDVLGRTGWGGGNREWASVPSLGLNLLSLEQMGAPLGTRQKVALIWLAPGYCSALSLLVSL